MTERITIAKTDTTMLICFSHDILPTWILQEIYHVHAFIAETRGFTMLPVRCAGARGRGAC